jgi:hypothetical protein
MVAPASQNKLIVCKTAKRPSRKVPQPINPHMVSTPGRFDPCLSTSVAFLIIFTLVWLWNGFVNTPDMMLSQKTSNGMAKQKAPNARRAIVEP